MFAMLCPSHHVCFARASSRLPSYSQEICMLCSEEYTTVALCQAPRYWAWRQQPLPFKLISQVSHGPMVPWWFTMGSPRHMPHWGSSAPSVCLAPQSQKEVTASRCLEFGTPPLTQLDKDFLSTQFAQLKQTF